MTCFRVAGRVNEQAFLSFFYRLNRVVAMQSAVVPRRPPLCSSDSGFRSAAGPAAIDVERLVLGYRAVVKLAYEQVVGLFRDACREPQPFICHQFEQEISAISPEEPDSIVRAIGTVFES